MLAREYCDAAGIKLKPIILSHHMLYGLAKGQVKMSKSKSDSAVFMEDSAQDVERKIMQAYCPLEPEAVELKAEDEGMQLEEDALKNPCAHPTLPSHTPPGPAAPQPPRLAAPLSPRPSLPHPRAAASTT